MPHISYLHSRVVGTTAVIGLALILGCQATESPPANPVHAAAAHHAPDTSFPAVQQRGAKAMGVDQYTSTHRFDPLPDGGRIVLQRDREDSAGTAEIRAHMRIIAAAFAEGNFRTPEFVHARVTVPGTATLTRLRHAIMYTPRDLPRGAELRITTQDSVAVRAVHEFLAFQRQDHHVTHQ